MKAKRFIAWTLALCCTLAACSGGSQSTPGSSVPDTPPAAERTVDTKKFAPDDMYLSDAEAQCRRQLCLNGNWEFAPMPVPDDFIRESGNPPVLPAAGESDWNAVPYRVPSAWNGNTWGGGRPDRTDETKMYLPDSVYYPSYPEEWDDAEMGWVRRRFTLPDVWDGDRIVLRFEAILGYAEVYLNGEKIGEQFDGYIPFEYDVTDHVVIGENEVMLGIRGFDLFNKQSETYTKMKEPYPSGSYTKHMIGIWQDVWLLSTPALYLYDVFVQTYLDNDTLTASVTLAGGSVTAAASVTAVVADKNGKAVMTYPSQTVEVPANGSVQLTFSQPVNGALATWSPDAPNLYTVELAVTAGDTTDHKTTRFGWRQFTIEGKNMYLNGELIRLFGDLIHPFSPYMYSLRFAESYYNVIKSAGGNAIRLHGQPYPQSFLDLADEMGMLILDESAIYGSTVSTNIEEESVWPLFDQHIDGMVLRDRNHPSVFGWSYGNELFAWFLYDDAAKRDQAMFYDKLVLLGDRVRALDPTRPYISSDGDTDMQGTLPVWSKHYGLGSRTLPEVDKPMVVGESGGTYYAKPKDYIQYSAEDAYFSYAGRNKALGIDLYNTLWDFKDQLISFSPCEIMWYGLEQLPFGFNDFDRLPTLEDGVFFAEAENFTEGLPGMYLERIPPYVGTLNPGFDPALPEYKPLDMYYAMQDGLKYDHAYDEKWAINPIQSVASPVHDTLQSVSFVGDAESDAYRFLGMAGVTFQLGGQSAVIDAATANPTKAQTILDTVTAGGGTVLMVLSDPSALAKANALLPYKAELTERKATMLVRASSDPIVDSLLMPYLYFAEDKEYRTVITMGLEGELVQKGVALLAPGETDWYWFNDRGENVKTCAIAMYENHTRAGGAALVRVPYQQGTILVSTIAMHPSTTMLYFYRKMLGNIGIEYGEMRAVTDETTTTTHDLLMNGPIE